MQGRQLLNAAWRISRALPIAVAVVLLLNLAGYLTITMLLEPRNQRNLRAVDSKQRQVSAAQQQAGEIFTPQKAYYEKEKQLETFEQGMAAKTDFTGLIRELFSFAQTAGLDIDQIKYSPKELETGGILEYGINFDVTGSYAQLKRFIFELEQSPRLLTIDEVVLTKRGEGNLASVGLRLKLTTFFREDGHE